MPQQKAKHAGGMQTASRTPRASMQNYLFQTLLSCTSIYECDEEVRKTDLGKAETGSELFLTMYELVAVVFTSWGIKINIPNTELQFCILLFCMSQNLLGF